MTNLKDSNAETFIKYAEDLLPSVLKGQYFKEVSRPNPDVTVSFQSLIKILDKYTKRRGSHVELDATIISKDEELYLYVVGISDVSLRQGKQPTRFPKYQKGSWSCDFKEALTKGIPPLRIRSLRESLSLTSYKDNVYGADNNFFWEKPEESL
ncbi:MAG: hypothetical protein A2173_09275 [Planctomycetes bacterium RBG_13_44_8b]|nr:MAG: hypothetical protein A2173_09275 [Planctomycetes bacterium RBG_13_44_8b]